MRELVTALAEALVEDPREVSVSESSDRGVIRFDVSVSASDRGRVIGRRGRTAEALRVLLDAVAERRGVRCDMEILD